MLRMVALGSCLLMALAGCSSGPGSDDGPVATASSSSRSVLTFAPPPPTTDTLHMVQAPHLAAAAPTGTEPIRHDVPTLYAADVKDLVWTMPRPDLAVLSAEIHLWVDVQGTVANGAANRSCFWEVNLRVIQADGSYHFIYGCAAEPDVPQPGVREVVVEIDFDIAALAGDLVGIGLQTEAILSPGASMTLLTGTSEYDSRVTIEGLQLPLDTTTLLV
jgi:hypothetical protein